VILDCVGSQRPAGQRAGPDGQSLSSADRARYELSYRADLAAVRIRSDQSTDGTARSIGARAYTAGNQINFALGQYQPGTADGQRLLAHELAHVVQQRKGGSATAAPAATIEADAQQGSISAMAGVPTTVRPDGAGSVRLSGDIRAMSISPQYAQGLSREQLSEQLRVLGEYLQTVPAQSAEHQAGRQNQGILQDEQVRRLVQGQSQSIIGDTVAMRHLRFQHAVLLSAQYRLAQNQEHLAEWRALVDTQMTAIGLRTQVLAQSAVDLRNTARQTGGMSAYDMWAGEPNPYRRDVYEHQVRGQWRACTGCHMILQADERARTEPHFGTAWQSPATQLSGAAGLPYQSSALAPLTGAASAQLQAAINAIRPTLAPLGEQGYRIIPEDVFSLRNGDSPDVLKARILAKIDQRRADYAELSWRIGDGQISYLQLGPVLQDLLNLADSEVRAAVQADIDSEHRWAILKIGGTIILALLSMLFPPLALAMAALQFSSGLDMYRQGHLYSLGTGANNVFTREQQDSGQGMMIAGAFSMATAVGVFATAAPGAIDMAATRAITSSDLAIAQRLAQRALSGPIAESELLQLQQPGLVGRLGQGWADARGFQVLYRGQGAATSEIVSPIARTSGVPASRSMYDAMRAQGLSDLEIAGFTAKFNGAPVPGFAAPPGMAGQPLGGVGIPTTRLPNIAADFANQPTGVIYVLRVPRSLTVPAAQVGWGSQSALEQEWVIFHQLPNGSVVRVLPGSAVAPLRFDAVPGLGPALTIPP
jgi:uncharacterized ParB-like nuclease family protein